MSNRKPRASITDLVTEQLPTNPSAVRPDQSQAALAEAPGPTQVSTPATVVEEVPAKVAPQPVAETAPVAEQQLPVQPQQVAPEPAKMDQTTEPQQQSGLRDSLHDRPSPVSGMIQKMSNVSVPLDPDRYFRLSIARVHTGKTAREILGEALDKWLIDNNF